MINLQSIIPWKKDERSPVLRREDSDPFSQLQRRMNGMFEDFLGRSFSDRGTGREFLPQVEVTETGKEVKVTAELPGLDEKDVEVSVGPAKASSIRSLTVMTNTTTVRESARDFSAQEVPCFAKEAQSP